MQKLWLFFIVLNLVNAELSKCLAAFEAIATNNSMLMYGMATSSSDVLPWMTQLNSLYSGDLGSSEYCKLTANLNANTTEKYTFHSCYYGRPDVAVCVPTVCDAPDLVSDEFTSLSGTTYELLLGALATTCGAISADPDSVLGCYLLNDIAKYWDSFSLFQAAYKADPSFTHFHCGFSQPDITTGGIIMAIVSIILVLLFVLASAIKYVLSPTEDAELRNDTRGASLDCMAILDAFSYQKNYPKVFTITRRNEFPSFDGIRAISMMWVVFGHCLMFYTFFPTENLMDVLPPKGIGGSFSGQAIWAAEYAVDSFFYLGGFLLLHGVNRKVTEDTNMFKFYGSATLHRILRISPLYYFAVLFYWTLEEVFASWGAFRFSLPDNCNKYGWTHFLYLNNLIPYDKGVTAECFGHTWYLAVDMQLFLFSFLFIYIYNRHELYGIIVTASSVVVQTIAITIAAEYAPWSTIGTGNADAENFQNFFYGKPWTRMNVYVYGILSAMIWNTYLKHMPRRQLQFTTAKWCAFVVTTGAIFFAVTYGTYSGLHHPYCADHPIYPQQNDDCRRWSRLQHTFYTGFSRIAWAVALSFLCYLCATKQASIVGDFLCHDGWVPIARLSFAAYIVHIPLISMVMSDHVHPLRYSNIAFAQFYVAMLVFVFAIATVVTLIIEKPFANLEMMLLAPPKRRPEPETEHTKGLLHKVNSVESRL